MPKARINLKLDSLARLAALLCAACCLACGSPKTAGNQAPIKTADPLRSLRPNSSREPDAQHGFVIESAVSGDDSVRLTVRLPAGESAEEIEEGFNLCLPYGVAPEVVVDQFRVGSRTLWPAMSDAPSTITFQDVANSDVPRLTWRGYLRHWPLWRLRLPPSIWKQPDGEPAEIALALTIRWTAPTGADAVPTHIGVNAGPIEDLVRRLIANPDGIARYRVASPPPAAGALRDMADPEALAPGATSWGKVGVERAGLVRIDPRAFSKNPGATPEQVRVFSEGRDIPTMTSGESAFFYAFESTSQYDPRRVYWIALDPAAAGPRMQTADPATTAAPGPVLRSLRRVDAIDATGSLVIAQGEFLNIQGVQWVNGELVPGRPLRIDFNPFRPLPAAQQPALHAVFAFLPAGRVPNQNYLTPVPPPETPYEVVLTRDDPTTGIATLSPGVALARLQASPEALQLATDLPVQLFGEAGARFDLRLEGEGRPADAEPPRSGLWLERAELEYFGEPALRDGRLVFDAASSPDLSSARIDTRTLDAPADDLAAFTVDPAEETAKSIQPRDGWLDLARGPAGYSEVVRLSTAWTPPIEPMAWDASPIDTEQRVDYLIIAHASLIDELQPLLALNADRLLRTQVVDVQRIYDRFSGGMVSPDAIRAFLARWIAESPATAPVYVLLAGDASNDYLHRTRSDVPQLVPSHSYRPHESRLADEGWMWASDPWYVCVAGDDDLADFQIGRLPAETPAQLGTLIAKIIAYNAAPAGLWRSRMGTIADNLEDFRDVAERVRKSARPAAYSSWNLYLDELALEDDWYIPEKAFAARYEATSYWGKTSTAATREIVSQLNQGTAFLSFFGHGSPNIWTHERIWLGYDTVNRDSQFLDSGGRYTFMVNYACNTGSFDYPMRPYNISLAEDMLRVPDGGAIATLTPSGPGDTALQEPLARLVEQSLFRDNLRGFGAIAMASTARYLLEGHPSDYVYMFNLLGDPALSLKLTQSRYAAQFLPNAVPAAGGEVYLLLGDLQPAAGELVISVSTDDGDQVFTSQPIPFSGGSVELPFVIPPVPASAKSLTVSVYGINRDTNQDWTAAGGIAIAAPWPTIASARSIAVQGGRRIDLTVRNEGAAPMKGASFVLLPAGGPNRDAIGGATLDLPASGEATPQTTIQLGQSERPTVLTARIRRPDQPFRSDEPRNTELPVVIPPAGAWTGILPELSEREFARGSASGRLIVAAANTRSDDPSSYSMQLRGAAGDVLTSRTLAFEWRGGMAQAIAAFDLASLPAVPVGAIHDAVLVKTGVAEPIDVIDVATLAERRPRMRIVPGSVSIRPASPSDGDTIWFDFTAENAGEAAGPACRPALFAADPAGGVERLPAQSNDAEPVVPSLGPGRSTRVTLRWDPIQNQGKQTVWIGLNPLGAAAAEASEQRLSYDFYVRSKSQLKFERPLSVSRLAGGGVRLSTVVVNRGETDSRAFEVNFYKSRRRAPEDVIGRAELPSLPAGRSQPVGLDFQQFDPAVHRPDVDMRLISSQQRVYDAP